MPINCQCCDSEIAGHWESYASRIGELTGSPAVVCRRCYASEASSLTSCERCGGMELTHEMRDAPGRRGGDDIQVCRRCIGNASTQERRDGYQSSAKRLLWPRPGRFSWGIEIETDCNSPNQLATTLPQQLAGESDCSLDHYAGMEIVSAPMPYSQLRELVSREVPRWVRDHGARSSSPSYGIHVSFNGDCLSMRNRWRFYRHFNRQPLGISRFAAGRSNSSYAPFDGHVDRYDVWKRGFSTSKYAAVNCRSTGGRWEVRAFKTSIAMIGTQPFGVLAALETVRSFQALARSIGGMAKSEPLAAKWFELVSRPEFENARRMTLIRAMAAQSTLGASLLTLAGDMLVSDAKRAWETITNDSDLLAYRDRILGTSARA